MQRHPAQQFAFIVAIGCYLAAVGCAVGAVIYDGGTPTDPVRAALMASVVFFAGCGVVLHVIGNARLRGLLSGEPHRHPPNRSR